METNKKRKQFGTRYLIDESAVFTHNAWDNVEWNEAQLIEAKAKVAKQKEAAVDKEEANRLKQNASAQWDAFYSRHDNKFFMDRNWLLTEFPELKVTTEFRSEPLRILEVGCGVGNTTFPLLNSCPHGQIFVYACDYSPNAIELLSKNEKFDASICNAFVWDISEHHTNQISYNSLDVVLCIYVLSAIPPEQQQKAVANLAKLLKPGGILLLKDYGEFDMTQLRFKKNRFMEDRLYCRGDGTLVYFFTQDELDLLLTNAGLTKKVNVIDRRLIVNRSKLIKMYRVWIQCKYVKPLQQ